LSFRQGGLFFYKKQNMKIAGIHPVREALAEGKNIEKVFIAREVRDEVLQNLISELRRRGIPVKYVPRVKLDKMHKGVHQGIVAVTGAVTFIALEELVTRAMQGEGKAAFLLLDGITDTRNLGALIRSAAAFGFDGIVLPAGGSAPVTEETVKTSAGAVFKIPMARVKHLLDAVYFLQSEGVEVVAATEKTEKRLDEHPFDRPTAVVLGNEHKGISGAVLKRSDVRLRIPMSAETDSLNVSVAGGIFMYEAGRRLKKLI